MPNKKITKKKSKVKRYLKVSRRRVKRVTRKRAIEWLKDNFKGHPIILGFLVFIWINVILAQKLYLVQQNWRDILILHGALLVSWFVLVVLSNLLQDKDIVKWYQKKRFIFAMLCLIPPLGLILLWSGTQFKRATRITLSLIFIAVFAFGQIYQSKRFDKLSGESSLDRIERMISKPKEEVYLPAAGKDVLASLQLLRFSGGKRVKMDTAEISSRSTQSVVSIKTTDKNGQPLGEGSGFVVSPDGIILTNFHVVESAHKAEIKVGDKVFKDVYFIKGIPDMDMAAIKINAKDLSVLPIGDSDNLLTGQPVVVLGNPFGFERSVSNGIVSALRNKGSTKVIQMTAPVSPGSSGGPVLNEYGEVVGITTLASFLFSQNLNFAVPINYLGKLVRDPAKD